MMLALLLALQDPEFEVDGVRYRVTKGDAYRWDQGRWVFAQKLYDIDFYAKNYVEKDGKTFRRTDRRLWEVGREFESDFAGAGNLRDLISETYRWTEFTLQSPRAPAVKDYAEFRKRILKGESDFLENRIDVGTIDGRRGLRFHSVAKTKEMICSKASIATEFVHFRKGDDLWFAAWYYFEEGMPLSIVDIESRWIHESPGPRVFIGDDGCAYVELKFGDKPKYRQKTKIPIPRKRWVRFQLHLGLSEKEGAIELWQDGTKILDTKGRTLPLADTVLNSLEVGISANAVTTTMYVAGVVLRDRKIE